MRDFIPYGKQWIEKEDIDAVISTLQSDFLTQGPMISEFENAICSYTGVKYAVAVSSATAGLHIAVKALECEPGSNGITTPNTFVATPNSLIYNKMKPIFADIDLTTYNIDLDSVASKIDDSVKVVLPVHFAGLPCEMKNLSELCKGRTFIIEDAAHALGSEYHDGGKVGNCKYSDMTVFSFHPVKTLTTGEGGIITTNNKRLYDKLLLLRSHGIIKDSSKLQASPGPWYYEMHELGYNYRITDIQAALGVEQLKRLDEFKKRRSQIVNKYNIVFRKLEWLTTPAKPNVSTCFHLYTVLIDFKRLGKSRKEVMEELSLKGIGSQVHYIPVHLQPFYQSNYGYKKGDLPITEKYYEQTLSLPLFPKMTDQQVDTVIDKVLQLSSSC